MPKAKLSQKFSGFVAFRIISETSFLADVEIDKRFAIISLVGTINSLFIYEVIRQVKDLVKSY